MNQTLLAIWCIVVAHPGATFGVDWALNMKNHMVDWALHIKNHMGDWALNVKNHMANWALNVKNQSN